MKREYQQWIAGAPTRGGGDDYRRLDPFSGDEVFRIRLADTADAQKAIAIARDAADAGVWSRVDRTERAGLLLRLADALEAEKDAIGLLESRILGAPLRFARNFVASAAKTFRYYAGLACSTDGDATIFSEKRAGLILREPAGVASLIAPWNFPLGELSWKLAPALAAGCTAVVKPDSMTAATTLLVAEILHRLGLPPGVLSVIVGEVSRVGPALTADSRIDVVSFTGSTASGRVIVAASAETVKPVHLELGGKSALIITGNCDLASAARDAAGGIFWHNGQICTACSRLLVEKSIYRDFAAQLVEAARSYAPGNPLEDATNGPLVSDAHAERVAQAIARAQGEGAMLTLDGRSARGAGERRNLIGPTIVEGLGNSSVTAKDEIFGPVTMLIPYETLDEAVTLANETPFGLGAGIWSDNFGDVMQAVRGLDAGSVWINGYGSERLEMPWGGMKQSGHGRELGLDGLRAFQVTKSVHISESPRA